MWARRDSRGCLAGEPKNDGDGDAQVPDHAFVRLEFWGVRWLRAGGTDGAVEDVGEAVEDTTDR